MAQADSNTTLYPRVRNKGQTHSNPDTIFNQDKNAQNRETMGYLPQLTDACSLQNQTEVFTPAKIKKVKGDVEFEN